MFALRIHSVDTDHFIAGPPASTALSPVTVECRGVVHLFRSDSSLPPATTSLPNPSSRSTVLFVVSVPNFLSSDEFIHFCDSHLGRASQILILRNDAMEDRYSVVIKFFDQSGADGFYGNLNGKRFSPAEAELCHILFAVSVEYTELAVIAGTPPVGFTELPTCPVCLERLDHDTSGILSTPCDHSFQCSCASKKTYLSCEVCRFCQQQDEKPTCSVCGTSFNLWACLICGFSGCGRYKEGHAIQHWKDTQHCYSLDLETQQVWDYVGDSYVHRLNQSKADGELLTASPACTSLEEDCGACECSTDAGISGDLYNSKAEVIADEYNRLLATQLETQRQYYESLLIEARGRKESSISEAVEKATTSKMQDLQIKLEKCIEEKKAAADVNQNLMTDQEDLRKKAKEAVEREIVSVRSKEEHILDLHEQIRDLKVYLEAQKTLGNMAGSNHVRGGTLLPVPSKPTSPTTTKRKSKLNRRRN